MACSIIQTYLRPSDIPKHEMHKITLDWTSHTDGSVSGIKTSIPLDGEIYRVVIQPDSGGTQPSAAYDMTILDDDSQDVLLGLGANLANDANQDIVPVATDGTHYYGRVAVHGLLELTIANAGSGKGGKVIIYWK